jgi:hypothetical protein
VGKEWGLCPLSICRVSSAAMPFWSITSTSASDGLRLPLFLLFVLPWWMMKGGISGKYSPNKLASLSDLFIWLRIFPDLEKSPPFLFFPCRQGGEGEGAEGENKFLHRAEHVVRPWSQSSVVLVQEQWRLPDSGDRLPAPVVPPPTLLVEWQPHTYSSRLTSHKGGSLKTARWLLLPPLAGCWRRSGGELVAPSGHVPGGGEYPLLHLRLGAELQSSFVIWGPLCKVRGLGCNFHFCLGPCKSCPVSGTI